MVMLLPVSIIVFFYMVAIFLIAMAKKDNSVVDIFWGPGFVVIAVFSLLQGTEIDLPKILMNLAVTIWGLRLGLHILIRNRGKGEDFRYKAWRDTWKFFEIRSFFQIFMLQGLFMLIIALPVYVVNSSPVAVLSVWDLAGMSLFLAGFYFEVLGDFQLRAFRQDVSNSGKLMTRGLWSITRHPNYFGESLIWWGIAFFALDLPAGWITLISPVLLTLLLRFVSGVPMLEKKYEGRPDWEEYKKKTAAFVPFLKFL
jgi:steroid 5-alpha reductase family enzyme